MKPVKQITDDDCLAACIASLLELPLALVPNFSKRSRTGLGQLKAAQKWLRNVGYTLLEIQLDADDGMPPWLTMNVPAYCILGVTTPRRGDHAVVGLVCDQKMQVAFDPDPDGILTGTEKFTSASFLVPALPPLPKKKRKPTA